MSGAPRNGRSPLTLALLIVFGVILAVIGMRSCVLPGFRGIWGPWNESWFFPWSGFVSIWWLLQLVLAFWVGRDAARRGLPGGWLWGVLIFFTSVVGLIVYLIFSVSQSTAGGESAEGETGAAPIGQAACPSCAATIDPAFKACPYCGAGLSVGCPQCGRERQPTWKVCPYCTTPYGEPGDGHQPST